MRWLPQLLRHLFSGRRALRNGAQRITAHVPSMADFPFHVHRGLDQYISGDLLRQQIWEPFETEVFRRLCTPGDFVVDIGANIGWYAVIASRLVGATGRVLALEPDAANLRLLQKNIATAAGAGKVDVLNVALGERVTRAKFFLSASNLGDHRLFDDGEARRTVMVPVQTLDALLADRAVQPTLLKSDTQGSEARIIRGARTLFATGWRPVLLLEFWPYGLTHSGDDPLDLWQYILTLGYNVCEVSEGHPRLVRLTDERLRTRLGSDLSPESMRFINLLCIPQDSPRWALVEDLCDEP